MIKTIFAILMCMLTFVMIVAVVFLILCLFNDLKKE